MSGRCFTCRSGLGVANRLRQPSYLMEGNPPIIYFLNGVLSLVSYHKQRLRMVSSKVTGLIALAL